MNKQQLQTAVNNIYQYLRQLVLLQIGKMRMKVGIQALTAIHRVKAKNYLDVDSKRILEFIILLDKAIVHKKPYIQLKWKIIPIIKVKTYAKIEERLFWVNRQNFKRIKRDGWMPASMHLDELRKKAFYTSSISRTYKEEYAAREKATTRYTEYLKKTIKPTR